MGKGDVLSIYSTRNPYDTGAACRVEWFGREWFAPVEAVRQTAEDLFTCAAFADIITELLKIGFDGQTVSGFLSSILGEKRPAYFGTPDTLFLLPGGSTARKVGVVTINRKNRFSGEVDGYLTPDEAREMGRVWLSAAEASESDTLFGNVLERAGWLGEVELDAFFGLLCDIRGGKAEIPPPREPADDGPWDG